MNTFRRLHGHQSGDTIVEVMIALVVITVILTGAFVVSNTSTRNVRTSQEHTEALQILQGQAEQVRALASSATDKASLVNAPSTFCIDGGAVASGNDCKNVSDLYNLSITRGPSCDTNAICTYIFSVDWDKLGGGTNHEQLYYRVAFAN